MKKRTKLTLQLLLPLLLLAAAGWVLVLWLAGRGSDVQRKNRRELLSSMGLLGDYNGFWVTSGSGEGRDFPSRDGLGQEELSARLDELLDLTDRARLNTVFFQARAEGAAFYQSKYFGLHPSLESSGKGFDPLDHLCAAGLEKRIQVYAVLDAKEGPGGSTLDPTQEDGVELLAASTEELAGNYPVAGVLFTGVEDLPEDSIKALLRKVKAQLKEEAPSAALGVIFPGESGPSAQVIAELTGEKTLSVIVPRLDAGGSFHALLEKWCGAAAPSARVLPALSAYAQQPEEARQLELRLLAVSMEEKVSGAILEDYGNIRRDPQQARQISSLVNSPKGPAPNLDFALPQELAVTYPAEDTAVTDSAIFLMGTSDPEQPLTLDGEEIERVTAQGTWGSLQKLEMGANVFTLRQGEETRTVTVERYTPGPAAPIRGIAENSVFPRYPCGVDSDAKLLLSCIAPAGGTVTATLGGRAVTLEPESTASQGTPLAYRGTLSLDPADYPPDATTKIGPVTYRLAYNGEETDYQSQGEVCVAGKNVRLVVENTAQLSAVLTDPDNDETIIGTLKPGARVYVKETVRTSRGGTVTLAYRLSGGGYILAGTPSFGDMVEVLEGAPEVSMEVDEVAAALDEKGGLTLTLGEGTPGITTRRTEEELILDCRDTTVSGELSQLEGGFIASASAQETEGGIRLTLRLDPSEELWGYDLCYEDGKTKLYLRPAPRQSDRFGRPLEGLSVLLDPGHGGSDPGAMGVAGSSGPAEAQLNLAVSQAVKYRLEQLGATVTLTRTDDSQVSLTQRVDQAAEQRPDLFLSIHHNSGVLTGNMNQARRMECYYFEDSSQPFARLLMDTLPEVIGRPGTAPEQARYYVTRQTANPAVLLEVGFMVNPLEYEECVDKEKILETAWGIGEVVQRLVEG